MMLLEKSHKHNDVLVHIIYEFYVMVTEFSRKTQDSIIRYGVQFMNFEIYLFMNYV